MPLAVMCGGCRHTFGARDDLAGKRVRCPSCGATVAIPAGALGPSGPQELQGAEESRQTAARERPRKRRHKRHKSDQAAKPAEPLLTLAGVELTAVKLLFVVPFVLAIAVGAFFLVMWLGSPSAPDVMVVDIYMAVNGVRYTDVGERVLQSATLPYTIPGHRKLVVTRENPEGAFLLIRVRIPNELLGRHLPQTAGSYNLTQGYIKLRGPDAQSEALEALFVTERDAIGMHLDMGFSPPMQERGPPVVLHDYLGPGKDQWSGWTHEGDVTNEGNVIRFTGKRGMKVTTRISAERPDGKEGRNVLEGLTGAKIGKGIEAAGLVAGPDAYVRVSWDEGSRAALVAAEMERPNDLSRSWELICLFPRPKGSGKELTLLMFNKEQVIKLP